MAHNVVCRWAEVQHLVDTTSLLFYARDAHTKTGKVIKYVTEYGTEVHQVLSDAGLAPVLYETMELRGGFIQVSWSLTNSLSCANGDRASEDCTHMGLLVCIALYSYVHL